MTNTKTAALTALLTETKGMVSSLRAVGASREAYTLHGVATLARSVMQGGWDLSDMGKDSRVDRIVGRLVQEAEKAVGTAREGIVAELRDAAIAAV